MCIVKVKVTESDPYMWSLRSDWIPLQPKRVWNVLGMLYPSPVRMGIQEPYMSPTITEHVTNICNECTPFISVFVTYSFASCLFIHIFDLHIVL